MKATAAAVKASATVEASEAGLPACVKALGGSSMIKATERTGVGAELAMGCESMLATAKSSLTSAMKSTASMESPAPMEPAASVKSSGAIEVVVIDEDSAVGYVAVMIEHDPVMPVVSPVTPSPAKAAKEANSKAKAPSESWAGEIQSGIPVPAWPDAHGCSIDEPWVILGNVDNLRVCGFDHNGLTLLAHLFLRCAL